MYMKSIYKISMLILLVLTGCSRTQEAEVISIGEELECLVSLSSRNIENLGVNTYDSQLKIERAADEYIGELLQSVERIPEPCDLSDFFADVPEDMIAVEDWNYDSCSSTVTEDRKKVIRNFHYAISKLQEYADGRIDEFPARLLMNEVCLRLDAEWMIDSEGYGYPYLWQLFTYRLLQQIVRYCPDISLIADFVSKDGGVGIIDMTLRSSNYQPCFNPVFLRGEDGQWHVFIDDGFLPNRAYRIERNGEVYYILSKHGDTIRSRGYDQFAVRVVKSMEDGLFLQEIENQVYVEELAGYNVESILFDPSELTWKACSKRGDYFHQTSGYPVLRLGFGESNPYFELL